MCGIAGVFDYSTDQPSWLDEAIGLKMLQSIAHRGPDDGGLFVAPGLLLGHRRLSILDLSDCGHQPMADESERCWISYNGEVYNFRELRSELEKLGHRFVSQTDTEVILRGYLAWGRNVVHRLNGMFAWALWDAKDQSVWLVRDGIGIKPLFYHDDGTLLRFGSEVKAILADDRVQRRVDASAIDAFLTFGYTPAPATGFEGVRSLEPGASLIARAGRLTIEKWYRLPYPNRPTHWTLDESAERLNAAINSSVRRQMVSDVPVGALLSGGLDSTAVVRAMKSDRREGVETFTIGFDDARFDESRYADRVARLLETSHRTEIVSSDVGSLISRVVSNAEEPFADNSMIPFFLLSQFVRKHVTVALSGDGADELLAGYDTYRASALAPYFRLIPPVIRQRLLMPMANRLPVSQGKYGVTNVLRRFVAGANEPSLRDHCSWRRFVPQYLRGQLLSDRFLELAQGDPVGQYAATISDAPDWLTPLERQLHVDMKFHLPNDMLVKVDRMSMAHSLEVRVPLLDNEVVEVCLSIPAKHKIEGKRGKQPLRRMLENDVPREILERKKAGFLIPLERWMQHDWQGLLAEYLTEDFVKATGIFRWSTVRRMMTEQANLKGDHAYPLFAMLVLSMWWRMWIEGRDKSYQLDPALAAPVRVHRMKPKRDAQ